MLDRASIERLSKTPEKNAPMLNVALAEEGTAPVLLALARSPAVGPEALEVIGLRVEREGAEVGADPEAHVDDDEAAESAAPELDRLLVAHPRAPSAVRDAILARHADDAYFVLAAATHPAATLTAVERAVDWPAASPAHDRLWLALLGVEALGPLTLEEWSQDPSALRREAVARIARDDALLERLAHDPARQVRRAVASNRFAVAARRQLAASDPAPDVRVRAAASVSAPTEAPPSRGQPIVDTARFAAALRAMATGGALAADVVRALSNAAELDPEGALLAGKVLPRAEVAAVADQVIDLGFDAHQSACFAAGVALRPARAEADADDGELGEVVYDVVKALARTTTAESRLTGKARLAAWAAEALASVPVIDRARLLDELGRGALGGERMILARGAALRRQLVAEICETARSAEVVPPALIELAWGDASIPEATLVELASRVEKPRHRAEGMPEDEVDLDPMERPLEVLERLVLTLTVRTNVSARAALPVVALDARRVRYVLSALPQWKGRLYGARLARVLRHHAGALSAARAEGRARVARIEPWTQRVMTETEASVALALGHLTGSELAARIASGRQHIDDGLTLSAGAEARAALEGGAGVTAILDWATQRRTTLPTALAVWLLLEKLDRVRAPSLIASSIDALSGKAVVHPTVCDALALIERRQPGRLETVHPQSPRGRATLASAIARAYRAIGGMRDERQ